MKLGLTGLFLTLFFSNIARAETDWNHQQIDWQSYRDGVQAAQKTKRPVLAVFHAIWCHYCSQYSAVFHDPRVVEASKKYTMVLIDVDKNGLLNAVYAERGSQIPRTLFMQPNGTPVYDFTYSNTNYPYYVEYRSADDLLGLMNVGVAEVMAHAAFK